MVQGSIVDPRQQRLDHAGIAVQGRYSPRSIRAKKSLKHAAVGRVLDRLALWRILRHFGEHTGAQLDRVLLVHRDARHARDRVAARCRELINDIAGNACSSHLSADLT
jgi:hypothetical protein